MTGSVRETQVADVSPIEKWGRTGLRSVYDSELRCRVADAVSFIGSLDENFYVISISCNKFGISTFLTRHCCSFSTN